MSSDEVTGMQAPERMREPSPSARGAVDRVERIANFGVVIGKWSARSPHIARTPGAGRIFVTDYLETAAAGGPPAQRHRRTRRADAIEIRDRSRHPVIGTTLGQAHARSHAHARFDLANELFRQTDARWRMAPPVAPGGGFGLAYAQ